MIGLLAQGDSGVRHGGLEFRHSWARCWGLNPLPAFLSLPLGLDFARMDPGRFEPFRWVIPNAGENSPRQLTDSEAYLLFSVGAGISAGPSGCWRCFVDPWLLLVPPGRLQIRTQWRCGGCQLTGTNKDKHMWRYIPKKLKNYQ